MAQETAPERARKLSAKWTGSEAQNDDFGARRWHFPASANGMKIEHVSLPVESLKTGGGS
jgi:hypothetical protein